MRLRLLRFNGFKVQALGIKGQDCEVRDSFLVLRRTTSACRILGFGVLCGERLRIRQGLPGSEFGA